MAESAMQFTVTPLLPTDLAKTPHDPGGACLGARVDHQVRLPDAAGVGDDRDDSAVILPTMPSTTARVQFSTP
jgi:hypothetical protein